MSLLLIAGGCAPVTQAFRGDLEGDLSWRGTIILEGDVVLKEGSHLVIEPGTRVLFASPPPGEDRFVDHPHFPGSELIVKGTLVAEGTPDRPILFASSDPQALAGSWGGINLMKTPSARFRFCRFVQADSALHAQESVLVVEESLFESNRVAIRFHTTDFSIRNNLIRNNGVGIRFHYGSPAIFGNVIRDNEKGIFITSYPQDYVIEGNDIVANREYSVALGEEVPERVSMKGNYWGMKNPSAIATTFFDGRIDSDLGVVDFEPFLTEPVAGHGISWNP